MHTPCWWLIGVLASTPLDSSTPTSRSLHLANDVHSLQLSITYRVTRGCCSLWGIPARGDDQRGACRTVGDLMALSGLPKGGTDMQPAEDPPFCSHSGCVLLFSLV
jgi:hypothetical protein